MLFIHNEDLAYELCFAMQTLNAHSRALLMQRLAGADPARYVVNNIAHFCKSVHYLHSFLLCSIGLPVVNGSVPAQQAISLPIGAPVLPTLVMPNPVVEPVGNPSECLLLKNMFDPSTEVCGYLIIYFHHVIFHLTKY